jgi:hypothetical protein
MIEEKRRGGSYMSNQTGMMMMLALHCIPPGPLICFRQLPIAREHARDVYIRMHDRHFYSLATPLSTFQTRDNNSSRINHSPLPSSATPYCDGHPCTAFDQTIARRGEAGTF